jgi:hypothetical protein
LIYRIAHRLAEVVHLLPIHSPLEGSADIGTEYPELDVIHALIIDSWLRMNSEHLIAEERKHTLIMVRRALTVPKAALAGVMLEIFSARFMASMAAFNEETAFSRPFGRWDLVAMVEIQGSHEKAVRGAGGQNPNRDERPSCHRLPRAVGSIR